jgi:Na+-translocating ferredoxin:NAD+ oxidoreductase RNF subunit RnfB
MNTVILYTVASLSGLGAISALILYFVAQKFLVVEDPRIEEVIGRLPGVNCGGCGFAGCRSFAEACVRADNLDNLFCPVGGNDTMSAVASVLGHSVVEQDPRVAVLRCNGSCSVRPRTNIYDGTATCAIASALYGGDTDCQYGCLGFGDCVEVCKFDALHMDATTGLPVVNDVNCTACGACVKACPRDLFELRKRAKKDRKIYVACRNEDKGGIARKSCNVACIGCTKCFKVCPYEAIVMDKNLAFIDSDKCKLCRKCVPECPTNSIIEIGFPPPREKPVGDTTTEEVGIPENTTSSSANKKEDEE